MAKLPVATSSISLKNSMACSVVKLFSIVLFECIVSNKVSTN